MTETTLHITGLDDMPAAARAVADAMARCGCHIATFDGEMGAEKPH